MMITITCRNETISFLLFSAVLSIHEYFKENVCYRNEIVTSMSPLSHLMIMRLLLCNQLKLICFTNMTSMNGF